METLKLMVIYDCKPNCRESFVDTVYKTGIIDKIRNEEGCISYDYFFAADRPNALILLEEWESEELQQAHMKQAHMADLFTYKDKYVNRTIIKQFDFKD